MLSHSTRGAAACRYAFVVPTSRVRHRRATSPPSTPGQRRRQREQRLTSKAFPAPTTPAPRWSPAFLPREVSASIATSSIIMLRSPRPAANTLDMRNAVHPFFVLNLDSPKRKQDTALRPKPPLSDPRLPNEPRVTAFNVLPMKYDF